LSDYLKKPPSPDQGISWPLAFLIGVVAVVVGWIVTHRPSAAPVVGAGGVAEEGPISVLFGIGFFLLLAGVFQVFAAARRMREMLTTERLKM